MELEEDMEDWEDEDERGDDEPGVGEDEEEEQNPYPLTDIEEPMQLRCVLQIANRGDSPSPRTRFINV